jgi:hypothetical protein
MAIYYYYFDYKEIRSAMRAEQIDACMSAPLPPQRGERHPRYGAAPTSTSEIAGT